MGTVQKNVGPWRFMGRIEPPTSTNFPVHPVCDAAGLTKAVLRRSLIPSHEYPDIGIN